MNTDAISSRIAKSMTSSVRVERLRPDPYANPDLKVRLYGTVTIPTSGKLLTIDIPFETSAQAKAFAAERNWELT